LLRRLPMADFQAIFPLLRHTTIKAGQTLYDMGRAVEEVYFPTTGLVSCMVLMEDGRQMEAVGIGREGMIGATVALETKHSAFQAIVQIGGEALRLEAAVLRSFCRQNGALRRLLLGYNSTLLTQVAQIAACNGLHPIQQRCSRWLLQTLDRCDTAELQVTHETLATMLGVRRASVTDVFAALQEQGALLLRRGHVTVLHRDRLERAACECYRTMRQSFAHTSTSF